MYTRKDYLDNNCTHAEYYGQFVTPGILSAVEKSFGKETLKAAFAENEHFNTQSTPLARWDGMAVSLPFPSLKPYGDYLTLAGKVCILKAAARIIATT